MKIARVKKGEALATACISGDEALIISPWRTGVEALTPFSVVEMTPSELRAAVETSRERHARSDIQLLPPAPPTAKYICLGLNYRTHVDETHNELPPQPALFLKPADAVVGAGEPVIQPKASDKFDFEGELCVVIGRGGRHIPREEALDHVFGYTIMMDGSVRDYQKQHSITAGKCFWRSSSLGPWIVTADEIVDPTELELTTRLNGTAMQTTTTDLMLYDIPTAISYISTWTRLAPGDVIATGTPAGVGARRNPPVWMKPGDTIEVEITRIGTLSNPVEAE